MAQRKLELRSPLKDKTLRNPGQSLDIEIDQVRGRFLEHGLIMLAFLVMLWIPLWQWLFDIPAKTMTIVTTVVFVGSLALYIPKMIKGRRELKRLRQARDGERAVAEYLDTLREDGHRVFHDIVGVNFNIDHIVIGPKGLFTIETKTLNKYVGKDAHLRFDGESVWVGEAKLPDNPVPQARAQAAWLKRMLAESTGKTLNVKPVVVFPGWFVEPLALAKPVTEKRRDPEVWVLEPKALGGFLKQEPECLKADEVSLAVFHLKRYIRATNI